MLDFRHHRDFIIDKTLCVCVYSVCTRGKLTRKIALPRFVQYNRTMYIHIIYVFDDSNKKNLYDKTLFTLLGISNNQKQALEEEITTPPLTPFLYCRNDRHHIEPPRNEIARGSSLTEDGGWKDVGRITKHQRLAARLAAHVSHFFRRVQHDELLILGLDLRRYQAQALSRGVVKSLETRTIQHERRSRETLLLRNLHDLSV